MYKPTGKRVENGKFEIHEYDMAMPVPEISIIEIDVRGNKKPKDKKPSRNKKSQGRQKRAAIPNTGQFWPNGRIPYTIGHSFSKY